MKKDSLECAETSLGKTKMRDEKAVDRWITRENYRRTVGNSYVTYSTSTNSKGRKIYGSKRIARIARAINRDSRIAEVA